ncbi:MAG: hypothetical protein IJO91_07060 [Oscillospiraceae bacterium]|nr:hypothetical protein [Oscillospiraceae bacterium]
MTGNSSLICKSITGKDLVSLIILAVISVGIAIFNIWSFNEAQKEIDSIMSGEMGMIFEMLENGDFDEYGDFAGLSEIKNYKSMVDGFKVLLPVGTIVYVLVIITAVMMVLRLRFSFLAAAFVYGAEIIFFVVNNIFTLIHTGLTEDFSLKGAIFGVILRVAIVRMLVRFVMFVKSESEMQSMQNRAAAQSFASAVPSPTPTIDPATGQIVNMGAVPTPVNSVPTPVQNTVPTPVGSTAPSQQGGVNLAKNTSAGGVDLAKPASKDTWQCLGCGTVNENTSNFCISCGTAKH